MELIDAFAGIAVGAWTGYITNDAALGMIFRAYGVGKLKFGGVIPSTRAQFIESLATLAEDELLAGDEALRRVDSEAFKDAAAKLFFVAAKTAVDALADEAETKNTNSAPSDGEAVKTAARKKREEAGASFAYSDEKSQAADVMRAASSSARELIDALRQEAVPAIGRAVGALSKEYCQKERDMLVYLARDALMRIKSDRISARFCERADQTCGNMPAKIFVGETLFGKIGENLDGVARYCGSVLEHELFDDTQKRLKNMIALAVDSRVTDAFFKTVKNQTLASVLGLDFENIAEFLKKHERERRERASVVAFDRFGAFVDDLLKNEDISGVRVGDLLEIDSLATAFGSDDIGREIDALTAAVDSFFKKYADDIEQMAERALTNASESDGLRRQGAAGAARRALIKGAGKRFRIAKRLNEAVLKAINGLFTAEGVGELFKAAAKKSLGQIAPPIIAAVSADRESVARTGNGNDARESGFFSNLTIEAIRTLCEMRPGVIYRRMSDATKADLCQEIARRISSFAVDSTLKPGAAQRILRRYAALAWEEAGNQRTTGALDNLLTRAEAFIENSIDAADGASIIAASVVIEKGVSDAVNRSIASDLPGERTARAADSFMDRMVIEAKNAMRDGRGEKFVISTSRRISRSLSGRIGSLIQGNVKSAIVSRLSGIDDSSLEDLARRFFGSLKYIAVLGAALGAIAGAACLFLDSSFSPPSIAARAALFALIGWGTNVLAVEALFRPRREKKIFGLKIRSVVSANKQGLADAVGRFLDGSLLDDGAVRHLANVGRERHSDELARKASAYAKVKIPAALRSNADLVASAAKRFAGRTIIRRNYELSHKAVGFASQKLFEAGENADKSSRGDSSNVFGDSIGALLRKLGESDADAIKLAFGSADAFGSYVEMSARASLRDIDAIWLRGMFRSAFSSSWDVFVANVRERSLSELAQPNDANVGGGGAAIIGAMLAAGRGSDDWAAPAAIARAAERGREAWPRAVAEAIARELEARAIRSARSSASASTSASAASAAPDKTAPSSRDAASPTREASEPSREATNADDSRSASPPPFWYDALYSFAVGKEAAVAETLVADIRKNAGFLLNAAWKAMGGDGLIAEATRRFIRDEAPLFVRAHAAEIDAILSGFAARLVRTSAVTLRPQAIGTLAKTALFDSNCVNAVSNLLFDCCLAEWGHIKAGSALDAIGFGNSRDALIALDPALRAASEALASNARIEADDIALEAKDIASSLARFAQGEIRLGDLLSATQEDYLELEDNLLRLIRDVEFVPTLARVICSTLEFSTFELTESLSRFLNSFARALIGEDKENDLSDDTRFVIDAVDEAIFCAIEATADGAGDLGDLWEALAKLTVSCGFSAMADEMGGLVSALELKDFATERVLEMDEEKIESMFKSFARPYLNKIKLYGLFGGVFGAHVAVPAASAIVAAAFAVRNRLRTVKK